MDNHQANQQPFESTNSSSQHGEVRFGGYCGPSNTRFNQFTPIDSLPQSNEVYQGSSNVWNRVGGSSRDGHRGF